MHEALWRRLLFSTLYSDLVNSPRYSGAIVSIAEVEGILEVLNWRLTNKISHDEYLVILSEWLRSLPRDASFQPGMQPSPSYTPPSLEDVAACLTTVSTPELAQYTALVFAGFAHVMGMQPQWTTEASRIFTLLDPARTGSVTVDTLFWLVLSTLDDEQQAEADPQDLLVSAASLMQEAETCDGRLTQTGLLRYFFLKQMSEQALSATASRLEALAARVAAAGVTLPEAGLLSSLGSDEVLGLPDLWFAAATATEARGVALEHPSTATAVTFLFTDAPAFRVKLVALDPAAQAAQMAASVQAIPGILDFTTFCEEQHQALLSEVCLAIGVGSRLAQANDAENVESDAIDPRRIEAALLSASWCDLVVAQLHEGASIPPGKLPPLQRVQTKSAGFPSANVAPASLLQAPIQAAPQAVPMAAKEPSIVPQVPVRPALVIDDSEESGSDFDSLNRTTSNMEPIF